ncbi:hypothetical protein [Deinococcus ruber]|uniref:hypothetical protein n=1 Tax=Deinococcus ruber TaxID=1848197 RepID=UPI00166DD7C9|nr:hypothetical protein [Deinococcus ruber]
MSDLPEPPVERLPRLAEWQSLVERPFSLSDLLYPDGNLDLSVAFAQLFWPTFMEIDGCVLRKERYSPDNFQSWMQSTNRDRRQVESLLNHLHVYDLFRDDKEYSLEVYEYVAKILCRTWQVALSEQFPDKQFIFHYVTEPDDYGPIIYFWQYREEEQGARQ